ncbi:MAG: CDP-alcohol phosphatidyltransferase family protein [Acetobacteraceae bacterium]|nr:CDP-alcohol phosphatidyltransferase family protein [Acetobacteraceae bacterium]
MSTNTLIHRIVRPVVRRIARTRITPNYVTTLRLVTGIAAAAAFAAGGGFWPAVGGGVFVLAMLLDRADGELARQSGRSSAFGHRYDLVSDCASNILAFIGIGVGAMPSLGALGPLLGILAGLGIGALFWQLNALKIVELRPYSAWGDRINADPDDALILVPVLVWCGAAVPALIAAAVITPLAALWIGFGALRAARGM